MFKSKIILAILLFSLSFKLNSMQLDKAFNNEYLYSYILTDEISITKKIDTIKKQIRDANNLNNHELFRLKEAIAKIILKKYQSNKITKEEEKLVTDFEESEEMHLFAKIFCTAHNFKPDKKIPASPELQDIYSEAKDIIKLKYNSEDPIYKKQLSAIDFIQEQIELSCCDILGNIYIEDNNCSYGLNRIAILHELAHKKRNHGIISMILNPHISSLRSSKRCETEADSIALETGNCYKCSEDISRYRSDNEFVSEHGYFTKSQILEIAKKQKEQKSVCKYHKNNQ